MSGYLYVKENHSPKINHSPRWQKVFAAAFFLVGITLIFSAAFPILHYELFTSSRFLDLSSQNELLSPLILAKDQSATKSTADDSSLLRHWLPEGQEFSRLITHSQAGSITDYRLSIPQLKIFDAHVKIGGIDLNESLIHFGGSALPGEVGNAIVFGHSVLPQFYNPKNYLTIFSLLPTLNKGQEIFVNYDGLLYKYVIGEMITVKPEDLMSLLTQDDHDSFLTLVTCVPPGTYWKRLAVKARLSKI